MQASLEQERVHAHGCMDVSPPNEVPPVMDVERILNRLPSLDLNGAPPAYSN
jgi:hypothetical protein